MSDFWTANRLRILALRWVDGVSSARIADELGTSKNAVIGKARRLGLQGRPSPIKEAKPKPFKPSATRRIATAEEITREIEKPKEKVSVRPNRVSVGRPTQGGFKTCQFIEGDPSPDESCKCGEPTFGRYPYCEPHARRAWTKVPEPDFHPEADPTRQNVRNNNFLFPYKKD